MSNHSVDFREPASPRHPGVLALALCALCVCGCATTRPNPDNSPGKPVAYEPVNEIGSNSGIGIESQDIVAATNLMARDMLADPDIAGRSTPPRVIIDDKYFINEGTSNLNKKLFTDRLRVELERASAGKILSVSRENVGMSEDEREFRKTGEAQATAAPAGLESADFRLSGRIMTLDKVDPHTGETTRYHQILFELINLETTVIAWNNTYEFRKTAAVPDVYR